MRQILHRPTELLIERRRFADVLLFGVTAAEFYILYLLTPAFSITDWIYAIQHLLVLGVALTRPSPAHQDNSIASGVAVAVAYGYSYAQIVYLDWIPGQPVWPDLGLIVVTLAALLSLASLLTLGRLFGIRPALRGLATRGPYRFVRHPMYLSYVLSDAGYNLQESNYGTILLMIVGWLSLLWRIHAEEQILSKDGRWTAYVSATRWRLVPGIW